MDVNAVVQGPAGVNVKAGLKLSPPAVRQCQHQIPTTEKALYNPLPQPSQSIIKGQILRPVDMYDCPFSCLFYPLQIQIFPERAASLCGVDMEQIVLFETKQKS